MRTDFENIEVREGATILTAISTIYSESYQHSEFVEKTNDQWALNKTQD